MDVLGKTLNCSQRRFHTGWKLSGPGHDRKLHPTFHVGRRPGHDEKLQPTYKFREPAKSAGHLPAGCEVSSCSVTEFSSGQDESVCGDWDNDPPTCSIAFPAYTEAGWGCRSPELEASSWEHEAPSWDSPVRPPFPEKGQYQPPSTSGTSPPASSSSSPVPRSSSSVPSSGSGVSSFDEGRHERQASPVIGAAAGASDAADALVPLVVALVRASPSTSVDALVDLLAASAPAVGQPEIRRLVTTAVTMEQHLASSLLQTVRTAMGTDPSGQTAFVQATLGLMQILARPQ